VDLGQGAVLPQFPSVASAGATTLLGCPQHRTESIGTNNLVVRGPPTLSGSHYAIQLNHVVDANLQR
jgi:hypothetical protein